ncbi:MAG: hypothetical protein WAT36_00170 [Chromatiaceae bacterium]
MSAPFVRKQLSAAGLLQTARWVFGKIPDAPGHQITLVDHLMSGLAVFGLKYPSLLQFEHDHQEETTRANLKALYGVARAPCDTRFRERLSMATRTDPIAANNIGPPRVGVRAARPVESPHVCLPGTLGASGGDPGISGGWGVAQGLAPDLSNDKTDDLEQDDSDTEVIEQLLKNRPQDDLRWELERLGQMLASGCYEISPPP